MCSEWRWNNPNIFYIFSLNNEVKLAVSVFTSSLDIDTVGRIWSEFQKCVTLCCESLSAWTTSVIASDFWHGWTKLHLKTSHLKIFYSSSHRQAWQGKHFLHIRVTEQLLACIKSQSNLFILASWQRSSNWYQPTYQTQWNSEPAERSEQAETGIHQTNLGPILASRSSNLPTQHASICVIHSLAAIDSCYVYSHRFDYNPWCQKTSIRQTGWGLSINIRLWNECTDELTSVGGSHALFRQEISKYYEKRRQTMSLFIQFNYSCWLLLTSIGAESVLKYQCRFFLTLCSNHKSHELIHNSGWKRLKNSLKLDTRTRYTLLLWAP